MNSEEWLRQQALQQLHDTLQAIKDRHLRALRTGFLAGAQTQPVQQANGIRKGAGTMAASVQSPAASAAKSVAVGASGAAGGGRHAHSPARIFSAPLGAEILGEKPSADLYLRNGFRLMALPASVETDELEMKLNQFRGICRLSPDAARRRSLGTGYEQHHAIEEPAECAGRLRETRMRLLCELLWPHVNDGIFATIQQEGRIDSDNVLMALNELLCEDPPDPEGMLIRHALAVVYHNRAIADEMRFLTNESSWSEENWLKALTYWAETIEKRAFWDYIRERIEAHDDPQVKPEDVEKLREELPKLLLGFNAVFIRAHEEAQQTNALYGHLHLIRISGFPQEPRNALMAGAVTSLVRKSLDPLVAKVRSEILDAPKELPRKSLAAVLGPVLDRIFEIQASLFGDISLPKEVAAQVDFDPICEAVREALTSKLEMSDADRQRAVQYRIILYKRLLDLPVSLFVRRKFEQQIRDDTKALYGDTIPESEYPNPAQCWFLEGQLADPDESLIMPVFKIIRIHGAQIQWQTRKILVPRSTLARSGGGGKVDVSTIRLEGLDPQTRDMVAKARELQKKLSESAARYAAEEQRAIQSDAAQFDKHKVWIREQEEKLNREIKPRRDRYDAEYKKQLALLDQQAEQTVAGIQNSLGAQVNEARAQYDKVKQKYGGLRGFHLVEMPIALLSCGVLEAVVGVMAFLPSQSHQPLAAIGVVAGLFGLAGAFVAGRIFRATLLRPASKALAQANQEYERQMNEAKRPFLQEKERITQVYQEKCQKLAKPVEELEAKKKEIQATIESRRMAIQKSFAEQRKKKTEHMEAEIKDLTKKAAARLCPKKESAKNDFPPYKAAKKDGFRDGEKPSDAECERIVKGEVERRMASLTMEQRVLVGKMAQVNPELAMNMLFKLTGD